MDNENYDELFPYNKQTLNSHGAIHCYAMILKFAISENYTGSMNE
jgi:hypothetical protein